MFDTCVWGEAGGSRDIPEGELLRLHCKEGFSTEKIARRLGWSATAVRNRLTDEATLARRKRQSIGMSVALNETFAFLLPKQDAVPEWQ